MLVVGMLNRGKILVLDLNTPICGSPERARAIISAAFLNGNSANIDYDVFMHVVDKLVIRYRRTLLFISTAATCILYNIVRLCHYSKSSAIEDHNTNYAFPCDSLKRSQIHPQPHEYISSISGSPSYASGFVAKVFDRASRSSKSSITAPKP